MADPRPLHVVLGAGQIGPRVAERLVARGHRVRLVRRGAHANPPAGVDTRSADVGDAGQATDALAGAAVVYHCINPLYHQWGAELPRQTEGVIAGAARAKARVIVLDNLYMYGRAPGGVMREDTPPAPVSKKGELRAQMAARWLAAHAAGDVRVAIGRASDFIGPGATLGAIFGERFFQRLYAGKKVEGLGDLDQPHSYSYTPDVADGLVALGADPTSDGEIVHLPVAPAESTRAVFARFGTALGRELKVTTLPRWLFKVAGTVSPIMREIPEMLYQWEAPFILDDARFRARYAAAATPIDEQITTTLAWAEPRYAKRR